MLRSSISSRRSRCVEARRTFEIYRDGSKGRLSMSNAEPLNVTNGLRFRLAPTTLQVVSAADRAAKERKFIWPLAATVMLVLVVWAVATELRLPPEQRAAIFAVQSQAYP
jgi:hypothetical protein